ncbi:DEKNAAC104455 [Brettanomyces naardenensis]|uniref:DEKNAAC104455 n=1 Tax=Brettanomyces naardenensis TaxID=13370 RepID=A0A448YR18_BRENA|nr:DEKNAAC104455 [Brettanomyces naardenensis]
MAVIYYRFRSQKPDQISTIRFDGTGLTVFELKREIIYANKLLNATDVDLFLYHYEDAGKEYEDDNEVIQRSSTVSVRRTSAGKKGKGNVARYIAGRQRLARPTATTFSAMPLASTAPVSADGKQSEEDLIKQMFNQQDDQWNQQQAIMATAQRVESTRFNAKLDENIPDYYICYKCGAKGKHHIRNCPKNNDPNWEGVRVKKTTGIPKSHLKAVDTPAGVVDDPSQNYMVNEQGKYVVAVADKRAWERYQKIQESKHEAEGKSDEIDVDDPELRDPQTKKLFRDPVRTKCCQKLYSRHVIEDLLLESDFKCPNCGQEDVYLDSLQEDEEMQKKVKEYLAKRKKELGEDENASKRQRLNPAGLPSIPQHNPGLIGVPPMGMPFMPFPLPGQLPLAMPIGAMPSSNASAGPSATGGTGGAGNTNGH